MRAARLLLRAAEVCRRASDNNKCCGRKRSTTCVRAASGHGARARVQIRREFAAQVDKRALGGPLRRSQLEPLNKTVAFKVASIIRVSLARLAYRCTRARAR